MGMYINIDILILVSPQKSQQPDSILKKIASSPIVDKTRTFGKYIFQQCSFETVVSCIDI